MSFLQPVKALFGDYLESESKTHYFIPIYQRGYKWEEKHIVKLLDDINNFQLDDGKFYCLQNITLIPKGDALNVVDGQQRLTTLTLILSYLGQHGLVSKKVRFPDNSIRHGTNIFLGDLVNDSETAGEILEMSWKQLLDAHPKLDHQDIFHIFSAYKNIDTWFFKSSVDKDIFCRKLMNDVKFIINKIDEQENEEKIFANLNSKRIPLDGSDLVRAMIITRVSNEESRGDVDTKKVVRLNERRVKIGLELDLINNWWTQPEIKNYFGKFVSISSEEVGVNQKLFKSAYPINLLYILFAEKEGQRKLTLEYIETFSNVTLELYTDIAKLHETLQDWYADREIYHYLAYLFNNFSNKISFEKVFKWWLETNDRELFVMKVRSKMRNWLFGDDEVAIDPAIDWYNNEKDSLIKILLLLDVIKSINKNQPFMPAIAFSKNSNDIEHIFPQNPEDVKEKKEYIDYLNKYVILDDTQKFDLSDYDENIDDEDYEASVDAFISYHIQSINLNSVGNLVLLYNSLNRSLGRIPYARKRARVVAYYNKGNFIQPHSFRVFIRDFNDEVNNNHDLERWDNNDILANEHNIVATVTNFFKQ